MKDKMKASFLTYSMLHSCIVVEGSNIGSENFLSTLKLNQCIFQMILLKKILVRDFRPGCLH